MQAYDSIESSWSMLQEFEMAQQATDSGIGLLEEPSANVKWYTTWSSVYLDTGCNAEMGWSSCTPAHLWADSLLTEHGVPRSLC